jgi:hypothetical protein
MVRLSITKYILQQMLKTPKGEIWRIEISEEVTIYFAIGFFVKFRGMRIF